MSDSASDSVVPPEAEKLLNRGREMAHVATSRDDRPHAAPIWYYYEDDSVEFVTGGKKLENIRANPRVALSIEHSEDGHGQWHVVLFGTAEVVTEEEELWAGRTRLFRRYRDREPTLEEDGEPPEALVTVDVRSVSYSG
jgi:nitroimidazol reductase NimA-like FMN-containing flavoprotein (pyridoxamine 5'-phosphate oxidase superfamily)